MLYKLFRKFFAKEIDKEINEHVDGVIKSTDAIVEEHHNNLCSAMLLITNSQEHAMQLLSKNKTKSLVLTLSIYRNPLVGYVMDFKEGGFGSNLIVFQDYLTSMTYTIPASIIDGVYVWDEKFSIDRLVVDLESKVLYEPKDGWLIVHSLKTRFDKVAIFTPKFIVNKLSNSDFDKPGTLAMLRYIHK